MPPYSILAIGLLALGAWSACDAAGPAGGGGPPFPNSLADTTRHSAQREIPGYGPSVDTGERARARDHARGQVLYVPVYSHIFHRSEDRTFDLTTTLSIRNTSLAGWLTVQDVDYFDSEGTLLKSYIDRPRRLEPLASTFVVIEERDRSGGVGANFIVTWESEAEISTPLIEAVMISTHSGQGISFTSPARVLQQW